MAAATLAEVAFFDIWPADNEPQFNANWNNYPFFASGNVILSGIEQGLYVLHPNLIPNPTTLLLSDVDIAEGNSGSTVANFTVNLSVAVPQTVTVSYATVADDATPDQDFTPVSGILTFAPNETSKVVPVTVFGDALDEDDETFQLTLSNPVNAHLSDSTAQGRILDDDPVPSLAIADVSVNEGDGTASTASFTVSLSAPSGRSVSAVYVTQNGTANGTDYTPTVRSRHPPGGDAVADRQCAGHGRRARRAR